MYLKTLFSFLFACMLVTVNAQFRSIPAVVTDAFQAKFGKASHVIWKDKLSSFQAEFQLGKDKVKASYSSKGEWLKTEKKYDFTRLPADVKDGLSKSKYADYTVKEVMEIDDKEKGLQYKLTVKKGDKTRRLLYFTPAGQLVKDDVNFSVK